VCACSILGSDTRPVFYIWIANIRVLQIGIRIIRVCDSLNVCNCLDECVLFHQSVCTMLYIYRSVFSRKHVWIYVCYQKHSCVFYMWIGNMYNKQTPSLKKCITPHMHAHTSHSAYCLKKNPQLHCQKKYSSNTRMCVDVPSQTDCNVKRKAHSGNKPSTSMQWNGIMCKMSCIRVHAFCWIDMFVLINIRTAYSVLFYNVRTHLFPQIV